MKKILIPSLMLLIGFITLSFTPAKDGVVLRLKPNKGATFTVNTKVSMMNMMDVQGQSITTTQVSETRQSMTVKDVNEKEVSFDEKVEALKLTISQMGMVLTYDSEHPEKTSPMLANQVDEISAVLNEVTTTKYDVQGNPVEEDEEKDQTSQSGSAIIPLADDAISEGSTWNTHKVQDISGTKLVADMNYKVTKVSKKSIEIAITGTISGDEEVSGSYEGTASINPETGMLIKSNIKMNASLTVSQQGMTFPLTMNGTTTVTVE
jgi:hypothetical protein